MYRGRVELVEIKEEEVQTILKRMKKRRAPGIDEVCADMIIAGEEVRVSLKKRLLNIFVTSIPEDWRAWLIVPTWKGKGDVQDAGKYRGHLLRSHVMKVQERILDGTMRKSVEMEIREKQQGFRKGRGMTDGMFTLRQLVEKRLEVQGEMALGFVGLEKADDTVPREMVMATLRWMGMAEAEVRLVEGMDKGTKGRVLVGPGMSEEFNVKIGLRQGSSLSPLMFIMVMELESRMVSLRGSMGRMLYADDLAVVVESGWEMQEVLGEWKEMALGTKWKKLARIMHGCKNAWRT